MADDADRAQEHMERMEELQRKHRPRLLPRASDDCVDCQMPIEARRLKALPHATRCIYCQQDQDRQIQRYGR